MRSFIRTKLTLMLTVLIMLTAAAVPAGISLVHSWPTHAATPAAVTIPSMKLPWERSLTTIPFTGGPFGNSPDKTCTLENKTVMSGVDFGLPQNTDVLAVAAGKVIYAGYTNNQIRNEVRIDHGGGFVTEYWGLNSINPSIVTGVSVAQGQLLGKSGYTPCPKCKNGISVHLRLEFRHYTSDPLLNIPLSAHGIAIDGYRIWTFLNASSGQGYNFQGTMTRGKTIIKSQSECGVNGVKTWYSLNGLTILAIANGTGGFLTSTNQVQAVNCGAWNIVPSPNPSTISHLRRIAAISTNDVWAVGDYIPTGGIPQPLAEHWDGTSWSIVSTPVPSEGDFVGITAIASNDVWVVGGDIWPYGWYTEYWDGTSWTVMPVPSPQGSVVRGIAAVSSNDIWVVGSNGNNTLTEHWDGASWSIIPSPNAGTPGISGNALNAVTAISTNDVWAVGEYSKASKYSQTLTEHWDGQNWSIVPSPNTKQVENPLYDVGHAPGSTDVWTVGTAGYTASNIQRPLAEYWDGKSWSIIRFSTMMDSYLYGVEPVSAGNVWAVGGNAAGTLVEHWNGASWGVVPSPNPPAANEGSLLLGVAQVPLSNQIWAVGFSETTGGGSYTDQTLIEFYC